MYLNFCLSESFKKKLVDNFLNFWLHPTACGTLAPQQSIERNPSALKGRVLTAGPPGTSL